MNLFQQTSSQVRGSDIVKKNFAIHPQTAQREMKMNEMQSQTSQAVS